MSRNTTFLAVLAATLSLATTQLQASTEKQDELKKKMEGRNCPSAKEYIATLNYIRGTKEFQATEEQAKDIAKSVVKGCEDSGKRFIQISQLLIRSGVLPQNALPIAIEYAQATPEEASSFVAIFRNAFASDKLDLDMQAALNMARSLSRNAEGDTATMEKDFIALVKFCTREDELGLPRPACGSMAQRVILSGQPYLGSVADQFIAAYRFIVNDSSDSPHLTTGDALRLAEELIKISPASVSNFKQAYQFAISEKGMKLGQSDAIAFAKDLASKTVRNQKR